MKKLRALAALSMWTVASLAAPSAAADDPNDRSGDTHASDAPAVRVVRPRSETGVVLGGVLTVGGGIGVLGGGALAIVGAAWAGQDCSFPTGDARTHCQDLRGDGPALRTAGLLSLAAGAALAVGGLYLALRSARAETAPAPPSDAFVRAPSWSRGDVAAAPAPIAAGTF